MQKATRRAATKRHEKAQKREQEEGNLFIHKELQTKALFLCVSLRAFLRLFVAIFLLFVALPLGFASA
ncbi:MAG: hypothetical protein ABFS37_02315 [Acidobacteriota bacterium]